MVGIVVGFTFIGFVVDANFFSFFCFFILISSLPALKTAGMYFQVLTRKCRTGMRTVWHHMIHTPSPC